MSTTIHPRARPHRIRRAPRRYPCPRCGLPLVLSARERALGLLCLVCADPDEGRRV